MALVSPSNCSKDLTIRDLRITNRSMVLKEQDALVLLKLLVCGDEHFTYAGLSKDLGLSTSEVHAGLKRAAAAGLFNAYNRTVNRKALREFLLHGLKYVFLVERDGFTRGIPTAHAAPPLVNMLAPSADPPPVWPHPLGHVRGEGFRPLYKCAPDAALKDKSLYEVLALVDAIRGGRARERQLAESILAERFFT